MAPACCPACRLLQPAARSCLQCGAASAPVALDRLTRARVEGITAVPAKPPTGLRDLAAVTLTGLGIFGGLFLALVHPVLALTGPLIGVAGYHQQFWRAKLVRRQRLLPAAIPARPAEPALSGLAQPHQRTLRTGDGPALVIATTIEQEGGVLVRAIEAVPFWLVVGERRVFITGACWAASTRPNRSAAARDVDAALAALGAGGLPRRRWKRSERAVARVVIAPGDAIEVTGTVRPEQLAGAGYRDELVDTVRGEPGAVVWIERVEPAEPDTPDDG